MTRNVEKKALKVRYNLSTLFEAYLKKNSYFEEKFLVLLRDEFEDRQGFGPFEQCEQVGLGRVRNIRG